MEESSRSYTTSHEYSLTCATKEFISSPPKKKHSMVLNLGNRSSSVFGADQTPTPTRFIRNCEEVGLFQDLQNVNPFEETFRKAVESGKTGSLALQSTRMHTVADDTLHTPHVFPHIIENDSICRTEATQKQPVQSKTVSGGNGAEKDAGLRPTPPVKVIRQEADTSQLRPIAPSYNSKPGTSGYQPVQLLLKMPDGRLMQLNATPVDSDKKADLQGPVDLVARVNKAKVETGSVILHTSPEKKQDSDNISPLIKEKLKARLGNTSANIQMENPALGDQRGGEGLQREEGCQHKRSSSASTNASNSEDDEETKRRKFLERNRAAAMRCREKRKFWVATLERRAEQMLTTNQQLQFEVGALRAEVAHLKTLLLAHKDCPVTQAMCNSGALPGSVVIPVEVEPLVIKPLTPIQISKPLSVEEAAFRQNLKKKLRTVSVKKMASQSDTEKRNRNEIPKKRLSLDIETAKQSRCFNEKDSPLVRSDEYLSSTLLSNEPLEIESFKDITRPVATQVIQINPNVLYRENSVRISSPNIDGALLPISPQTNCIDYS